MLTIIAVTIAFNLPITISAIAERYAPALHRPEALVLGELDDSAARPRPCAGFETLDCRAAECPRHTSRARPIHRRIARKLTWV